MHPSGINTHPPSPRPRSPAVGLLVAAGLSVVALGLAVKNSGWLDGSRPDATPRPVTARGDLAAAAAARVRVCRALKVLRAHM